MNLFEMIVQQLEERLKYSGDNYAYEVGIPWYHQPLSTSTFKDVDSAQSLANEVFECGRELSCVLGVSPGVAYLILRDGDLRVVPIIQFYECFDFLRKVIREDLKNNVQGIGVVTNIVQKGVTLLLAYAEWEGKTKAMWKAECLGSRLDNIEKWEGSITDTKKINFSDGEPLM